MYCIVLYFIVLCYCIKLYCMILHYTILHYIILHYISLYYIILHHIILYYIVLYYIICVGRMGGSTTNHIEPLSSETCGDASESTISVPGSRMPSLGQIVRSVDTVSEHIDKTHSFVIYTARFMVNFTYFISCLMNFMVNSTFSHHSRGLPSAFSPFNWPQGHAESVWLLRGGRDRG